ncbi:MAG: aminotransferase class I/II-fold pyridoxal phosphate-dependent enzyme, partial [Stellaceae bacterium]
MRFSPRIDRVAGRGAGAWGIAREAARLRELGHDVISLTVGDPDQAAPAPVIEATIAALRCGRTGYAPIIGLPKLREAVAGRVSRRTGKPCTADNVTLTPGAQGGLYCALQCLAGPGDE